MGKESQCLRGAEFQSGKRRRFWRRMAGMVTHDVNVVHASELYHEKLRYS